MSDEGQNENEWTPSEREDARGRYNPAHLKIPKGQKLENFDFYEFSEDLTNSITDQLYRSYHSLLEDEYREYQRRHQDEDIRNDMDVQALVHDIRRKTNSRITRIVSDQIANRVSSELQEQYHARSGSLESNIDKGLRGIRWIMIAAFLPIAVVVTCIALMVLFETVTLAHSTFEFSTRALTGVSMQELKQEQNNVVAAILSILDMLLIGSLVIMVLIGGYENTISRIGITHSVPTWFGKLDIAQLKIKVAASIVIISSIHLLMAFMQIDLDGKEFNADPLMWTALVHIVFVVAAVALAYMDRIQHRR